MTAAAQRRARQLPAFGRALLDIRRRGLVPLRHAHLGHVLVLLDNWRWGRIFDSALHRLVVPTDADPTALDFAGTAGLDVTLVWSRRYSMPSRMQAALASLVAVPVKVAQVLELDCVPSRETWYVVRPEGRN